MALMWPGSNFIWRGLPELKFVQFPWRWLDVLDVVFAFFVAATMNRAQKRWVSWLAIVVVFAGIGAAATAMVRNAWWDSEDVPGMANSIRSGRGYEGADEYAPTNCDRYQLPGDPDDEERVPGVSAEPAPPIGVIDPASGIPGPATGVKFDIVRWSADRKEFFAGTAAPVTLAVRLVNYPAWQARIDGREIAAGSAPETAQMLLPIGAGTHRIAVDFARTWDRTAGDAISALAAITLVGFAWGFRRRGDS